MFVVQVLLATSGEHTVIIKQETFDKVMAAMTRAQCELLILSSQLTPQFRKNVDAVNGLLKAGVQALDAEAGGRLVDGQARMEAAKLQDADFSGEGG